MTTADDPKPAGPERKGGSPSSERRDDVQPARAVMFVNLAKPARIVMIGTVLTRDALQAARLEEMSERLVSMTVRKKFQLVEALGKAWELAIEVVIEEEAESPEKTVRVRVPEKRKP